MNTRKFVRLFRTRHNTMLYVVVENSEYVDVLRFAADDLLPIGVLMQRFAYREFPREAALLAATSLARSLALAE